MSIDRYQKKWMTPYWPYQPLAPMPGIDLPLPNVTIQAPERRITQAEVDELRRLLERAREYDKRMNQPDCELDEKRLALKKIAAELGVEIAFL